MPVIWLAVVGTLKKSNQSKTWRGACRLLQRGTWRGVHRLLQRGTWRGACRPLQRGTWRGACRLLQRGTWRGARRLLQRGTWRGAHRLLQGNQECIWWGWWHCVEPFASSHDRNTFSDFYLNPLYQGNGIPCPQSSTGIPIPFRPYYSGWHTHLITAQNMWHSLSLRKKTLALVS